MLGLVRGGYGRDLFALFLLTVLLGGALVGGLTRGVDRHFEGAVSELIGTPGEYDILIHLRADVGTEGIDALAARFETIAPGFSLKVGPTLAGRMNLFVGVPDARRDSRFFESLNEELRNLPGFDGYTLVVEPSVIVKDAHPLVRERLMAEIERMSEVRFAFEHAASLWVVLSDRSGAETVRSELKRITERMSVVDVRFPLPLDAATRTRTEARILDELSVEFPHLTFKNLSANGESDSLSQDLIEVRRLLDQVADGSDQSLAATLDEVATALERAAENVDPESAPSGTLDTFYGALDQMHQLEERLNSISEQLRSAEGDNQTTDVLIAMLLQRLIGTLAGESTPNPTAPSALNVEELREGLDQLADRLSLLSELDFANLATSLRQLEGFVGGLDSESLYRAMGAIDRLIAAESGSEQRLEILTDGSSGTEGLREVAQSATAHVLQPAGGTRDIDVFVRSAGVVEADARTGLMLVIDKAVDLIVLLAAFLFTSIFFLLDTSTLLSFVGAQRTMAGQRGAWLRVRLGAAGGAWFALVLTTVAWLSGGVPFLHLLLLAMSGFAVGFAATFAAQRVSPVDADQLEAAVSLGMPNSDILRRVVIPGGRPGLLLWFSRAFVQPMGRRA